jgi:hypothetical protein
MSSLFDHFQSTMTTEELTELQRSSLYILTDSIIDSDVLSKGCPLDHGRHTLKPKKSLGSLIRLPTELQHYILGEVDLESHFVFRRVNQSAMFSVNGMVEYQKVYFFAYSIV